MKKHTFRPLRDKNFKGACAKFVTLATSSGHTETHRIHAIYWLDQLLKKTLRLNKNIMLGEITHSKRIYIRALMNKMLHCYIVG